MSREPTTVSNVQGTDRSSQTTQQGLASDVPSYGPRYSGHYMGPTGGSSEQPTGMPNLHQLSTNLGALNQWADRVDTQLGLLKRESHIAESIMASLESLTGGVELLTSRLYTLEMNSKLYKEDTREFQNDIDAHSIILGRLRDRIRNLERNRDDSDDTSDVSPCECDCPLWGVQFGRSKNAQDWPPVDATLYARGTGQHMSGAGLATEQVKPGYYDIHDKTHYSVPVPFIPSSTAGANIQGSRGQIPPHVGYDRYSQGQSTGGQRAPPTVDCSQSTMVPLGKGHWIVLPKGTHASDGRPLSGVNISPVSYRRQEPYTQAPWDYTRSGGAQGAMPHQSTYNQHWGRPIQSMSAPTVKVSS